MQSLRIALVHAFAWPEVRRGGERLVHDLTTYLRGAGHTVDVFCGTRSESQFNIGPRGRSFRLRTPWLRALDRLGLSPIEMFGLRALAPLLAHRYDVVHAFTPTAALAARLARQRTIYTVIGHPTPGALPRRRAQRSSLVRAVASATEVAALSRSAAESVRAAFGRAPIVLAPGVWVGEFSPGLDARVAPPRLLFSADLGNRDKGLPVLLAAFDRLLVRHPDMRLALSGSGSAEWAFQEIGSARERIEGSIDMLGIGAIEDVPDRYRSAHVTVVPSRNEAFGIVFVESLACGTPVVAGTPGGAQDIVVDERIGRLVPFGDADALAAAIEACLALANVAGTAVHCRTRAEAWDWRAIGPSYEAVYSSVAGGRGFKWGGRRARSAARPSPS